MPSALLRLCAALALGNAFGACAQGVDATAGGGGASSAGSAGAPHAGAQGTAGSGVSGANGEGGASSGAAGESATAGSAQAGSAGSAAGASGAAGSSGSAGNAAGGASGTAGQGGSIGQAGSGGSTGQAGSSGSAGQASGGAAGQGGSGGSAAGQAGTGGSAGQAGSGGGAAIVHCSDHPIPAKSTWKVTASSAQDVSPVANMIDGNVATRWSSGVDQKNDWIQVDFGAATALSKITLALGNNPGDYPRMYQVRISNTALDTTIAPLASGNGQQATDTVVSFATPALGRYLLISQVGTVTGTIWWSVAELTVACTP